VIVFSLFSLDLISCIGKTRLKESQTLLKKRLAKAEQFCESEDVKNAFDEPWIPSESEDLERLIFEHEAKVSAMGSSDFRILNKVTTQRAKVESMLAELNQLTHERDNKESHLVQLKTKWLEELREIMKQLDSSISLLFSKIGFEACVDIETHESVDKFGLNIKVKFRKNAELQVLSGSTHSGGERSVSTMLFLLALQTVSEVPFRVVDEINQGMDPVNERMVFDRIVEHCGSESQYFIVTPKLLPDLQYGNHVTVHIVNNGIWNFPQNNLLIEQFLA